MTNENNYRLLVIDDVASIHEDFRKILLSNSTNTTQQLDEMNSAMFGTSSKQNQIPPFKIDSAIQGQAGVDLVKKSLQINQPYAVAFVDVQMPPGMDGIETIEHIWKMDSDIQTVICTAYAKYSWIDILMRFGDTDRLFILKKPFDNIEILQLASSLTKKWNQSRAMKNQLHKADSLPQNKSPNIETVDVNGLQRLNDSIKSLEKIHNKHKSNY